MPSTLADGPLGLEGRHAFNGITVNDIAGLPYLRVDKLTGLGDVSEANDPRDQLESQIGEVAYPSLRRGKTIVYSGRVIGRSLLETRALAASLRAAASSLADMPLAISPHPTLGGPTLTGYGRPIACVIDDEQTLGASAIPSPWQRPFVLSFRLRDPRFFDLADAVTVGAGAGVAAAATVPGNAPAEPVFTINGPTTGAIVIENLTSGKTLAFTTDISLLGGETMIVDFLARQARIAALDAGGAIDWGMSNWWDEDAIGLAPAIAQNLRVSGAGTWSMTAFPAVW